MRPDPPPGGQLGVAATLRALRAAAARGAPIMVRYGIEHPSLVRSYSCDSFRASECAPSAPRTGSIDRSTCPQFDRLLGSRVASNCASGCSGRANPG
jgi:hypothetical protein